MANQCKYYKVVRQVSYDSGVTWVNIGETRKGDLYEYNSPACGAITEYRWVDVPGAYTCEGTTKYKKTKRQYSEDGGQTWSDVSPAEYGKGDVIEYQSSDCGYDPTYLNEYLTFVPRENGNFRFYSYSGDRTPNMVNYSLDGGVTWTLLPNNTYTQEVRAGQKIMWKANFMSTFPVTDGVAYSNHFRSNCSFDVEGNVMSLLYSDSFQGKTSLEGTDYVFVNLFLGCDGLVSAEHLMLPATTLGNQCYQGMFSYCTGLTIPPELPATTLADGCYFWMFLKCTSLTTAPDLPATTLSNNCYQGMFGGCTSLNYIKCLATNISANQCTEGWVDNVASSGTFVKDSDMSSWTRNKNGIPLTWTVQNA